VAKLVNVRGIENTSEAFRRELFAVCGRLGCDPNKLAAVMSFETAGSFDPAQKNLGGGSATGLIQFMPYTASKLGTTTAELAAMSDVEQLAYVEKYLRLASGGRKLVTVADHYMAVFAPSGIGKPPGFALYKGEGKKEYEQNKGLDYDHDFRITVAEASAPVAGILRAGLKRPFLEVDLEDGSALPGLSPLASSAAKLVSHRSPWLGRVAKVAAAGALAYAVGMIATRKETGDRS